MHLALFITFFNWSSRNETLIGIGSFFLTLIPLVFTQKFAYKEAWIYALSALLNIFIFPFIVYKFWIIDPVKKGYILKDQAIILGSKFNKEF